MIKEVGYVPRIKQKNHARLQTGTLRKKALART
jgi:hypothetical protein